MSSMTGKILNGRYEIGERIGAGGMAEVYSATDNVLGRIVAVKIMLSQYAEDEDFARRFRQEAAAAANLQSPYIVNVYDWGHDQGTYFIVMEYVRGSDLKSAIKQRGAINQRKVAEIGSQVCQALSVAHAQDIVHRDIKPQNIMVQPDGNVKVMDFGIARAKNTTSEKTGNVLGTAHYISPEQAQGQEVGPASDIYSLGVVLYEASTGKLPFDGPDAMSVALMQVQDEPLPPSSINPDIDPALERIILKAMQKNPSARFATAHDMKLALNDYLAGRLSSSFTQAKTSFIPVTPATAAGAGVAGAAVAAGAAQARTDKTEIMPSVGSTPQNDQSRAMSAQPSRYSSANSVDKKNIGKIVGIVAAIVAVLAIAVGAFMMLSGNQAEQIEVPTVTGLTSEAAQQQIQAAGFTIGAVDSIYDDSVEAGKVVSQSPKGGDKADKGSKISITVSQGTEKVDVPDVTNQTESDARQALTKLGLTVKTTTKNSDDVDQGKVISSDPAAGASVAKGSVVNLVISKGTDNVTMPSVYNYDLQTAQNRIVDAGLVVGNVTQQNSDTVASGYVISASLSAGATVEKGTAVDLVVSSGPQEVTVDWSLLLGMNQSDAVYYIQSQQGYSVGNITYQTGTQMDPGHVANYSLSGKSVNLVISSNDTSTNTTNSTSSTTTSTTN